MTGAKASAVVGELAALFDAADFEAIQDALEQRVSREEARATLGPFARFLEERVHPEIVIDYTHTNRAALMDGPLVYSGWDGWLEHWRNWFSAWSSYEGAEREIVEIDDERAILIGHDRMVGRASGIAVEGSAIGVWTVRDGRLLRFDGYPSLDEALAAARR